jgi:hypothetical protein
MKMTKDQQAVFEEHYWNKFPEAGSALMFGPLEIGNLQFACMIEAKMELSINMRFNLYVANPSAVLPVQVFIVEIPLKTIRSGAYQTPEGKFSRKTFVGDIEAMISKDLAGLIETKTKTGITDPRQNLWAAKVCQGDHKGLAEFIIRHIAKAKVTDASAAKTKVG